MKTEKEIREKIKECDEKINEAITISDYIENGENAFYRNYKHFKHPGKAIEFVDYSQIIEETQKAKEALKWVLK